MPRTFSVDARAMLTWGRESIKDDITAIVELVKNSYDADATAVVVTVAAHDAEAQNRFLRVSDNGVGMSGDEVDDHWLRLGFSEKRRHKRTKRKRRKTGEKGIGRISADRLGRVLELKTQARNHDPVGLRVCWDEFEEPGRDLASVPLQELAEMGFLVPGPVEWDEVNESFACESESHPSSRRASGTELTIRGLRDEWTRERVGQLRDSLAALTPPFKEMADFQIRLETDLDESLNGIVDSPFMSAAEIEAEFDYEPGESVRCRFRVRRKDGRQGAPTVQSIKWNQFVSQAVADEESSDRRTTHRDLGTINVILLFYPRRSETLRGTTLALSELRSFLDVHAGIKVYRDDIRVMPYGDPRKPEGDWLGLGDRKARNPAGAGREDWRVSPNQLVGGVFLGRDDNPELSDTSGREGLVQSDAYHDLHSFLMGCVFQLEAHYHKLFLKQKEPRANPQETVNELRSELDALADSLQEVEVELPTKGSTQVIRVREQIDRASDKIRTARRSIEELASQATTYRGLATLGIASATFGHETEGSIEGVATAVGVAAQLLRRSPDQIESVLDELTKAQSFAKRVSAWGAFALGRIKRDKRRRAQIDVSGLVRRLIDELRPAFVASDIRLVLSLRGVEGRIFPMDVESVLLNLLTNAYYFSKKSKRERVVSVDLKQQKCDGKDGLLLEVADSGPGVATANREDIWRPLFTTKVDARNRKVGTGLGLAIVDNVVSDLGGTRKAVRDDKLRGARMSIWLPLR